MRLGFAMLVGVVATILVITPASSHRGVMNQEGAQTQDASSEMLQPWATLAPAASDGEAQLAVALHAMRQGAARKALAVMHKALGLDMEDELRERVVTERGRMEAWLALRTSFIDHVVAQGIKLTLEIDGSKLITKVLSRSEDQLELAKNRRKLTTLSLEEIPPVQIAASMAKGGPEHKAGWVRVYGYAVAGDERWGRLLRDKCDDAEALRRDAQEVYPALLQMANAVAELASLATVPAPSTGPEADSALARIETLRTTHGALRLVREAQAPMAALARSALEARFDAIGLEGVMQAKVETLGKDRVRLTYDFEKEEQQKDFIELPDYLDVLRSSAGKVSPETEPRIEIKDGALVGTGSTCVRLPLPLASPTKVSYEFKFVNQPESQEMACRFMLGLLDDGKGSFAGCIGFGNLLVRDKRKRVNDSAFDTEGGAFYFDQIYEVEVAQDAKGKLVSSVAGEKKQELDAKTRTQGSILLWFHAECSIAVHNLVIEATLPPGATHDLEETWIEAQLAELGFE